MISLFVTGGELLGSGRSGAALTSALSATFDLSTSSGMVSYVINLSLYLMSDSFDDVTIVDDMLLVWCCSCSLISLGTSRTGESDLVGNADLAEEKPLVGEYADMLEEGIERSNLIDVAALIEKERSV